MSKIDKQLTSFERYLREEIAVEFKACLYFFCILFFYAVYKLIGGSYEANIIHMTEMIFLTYGMCYAQIYLMNGFDEGETFGGKEGLFTILCAGIYTFISWIGNWFNRSVAVSACFFGYVVFAYIIGFVIYKIKRTLDEKVLNNDLKAFQERRTEHE